MTLAQSFYGRVLNLYKSKNLRMYYQYSIKKLSLQVSCTCFDLKTSVNLANCNQLFAKVFTTLAKVSQNAQNLHSKYF